MKFNLFSKGYSLQSIAERSAAYLSQVNNSSHVDFLKMKLGIETLLINLTKGIAVYGLAIIFNNVLSTLILHGSYVLLRQVSFGLHAKSSTICTFVSVIKFNLIPLLIKNISINNGMLLFLFIIFTICVYFFAPADTEKNQLKGEKRRKVLRDQSLAICIVLMIVAMVFSPIRTLVTTGVGLQVMMILPITYKILGRRYNNYEHS